MEKNIQPWVNAIDKGEIESRVLITNKAIIETFLKQSPKTVLDIGCGEGWLVSELKKSNISLLGNESVTQLLLHLLFLLLLFKLGVFLQLSLLFFIVF
ncbi:MAG: hypothetical protein QM479_13175 [Pseudomonadota bacterium]